MAEPSHNPGQRILLGIGAGIAAYKSIELVRHLRFFGAEVVPVLTANAGKFVTSTALQAIAGVPPRSDLWDAAAEAAMGHIELARWADAVIIAPATADLIGRLASGLADDLLTTICLATTAPRFLAPAMNTKMWEHPATRRNIERLRADGAVVLGPDDGEQACGEFGIGRMVEPDAIAAAVRAALAADGVLQGVNVLVTAGPTREFLDPVRFISNRSSGRQGFAIAEAARAAGAEVTLVAGPVQLPTPPGVTRVDVVNASEMHAAVQARAAAADIFFSVAAVADYRPRTFHPQKLKKRDEGEEARWALRRNVDIASAVAAAERRPFVVGFAAETEDAIANARDKRERKNLDAIVANDVANDAIGFDSVDNAVTLIHQGGELTLPKMPKREVARRLVAEIAALYRAGAAS